MKKIDYLFKCVSRIYHIKLKADADYQSELVESIFWERLLNTYLIELKRLTLVASIYTREYILFRDVEHCGISSTPGTNPI